MATPTVLTTTVSGRLCTRSRARSAAASSTLISTSADIVTSTELTSSTTTTSIAQEVQSSAIEDSTAAAAATSSTDAASSAPAATSSASGTDSPVAQVSALADLQPSPAVAAVPGQGTENTATAAAAASELSIPSSTIAAASTTSSDAIIPAITSSSSDPQAPAESAVESLSGQSSIVVVLPSNQASHGQAQTTGISSAGSAGLISPETGNSGDDGLTIDSNGQTNVGGIVGGVVGGFLGIALVSALLFFCLRRKRAREPFEKWQQRMNEKEGADPTFLDKLKAIPGKLKAIPASVAILVARVKGKKAGPTENPYRRHTAQSSVSSVYSVQSNRRSRSISEPPSRLRQQLRGFGDRFPSLKRSRTLLGKKQDSPSVVSLSPFPGIVEDPVIRHSKAGDNPFADPTPLEPPKTLVAMNPDLASRTELSGLDGQQRPPLSPKPVATSIRGSKDPFASILDELEERDGSGTPEWLRETSHKRTESAQTALRSHPPSSAYTASIYTTADNPFLDPTDVPPVPSRPLPPNPPIRPGKTYTPVLPKFDAMSSGASRESNTSFFFGEPGPSRPTTNMFSTYSAIPRAGRQSDPFDLDRPEVLGFGTVGGRTVRGSVTRQNSRRRTSSVPNWVSVEDGPYERASAVPGPLNKSNAKR